MPYLRREAELSSRIEGTRATLEDLYLFEVDAPTEAPPSDVEKVLNYVKALYLGLDSQLPISQRLVRLVHEQLMQGVRGDEKRPGKYRRIQNFIAPEGIPLKNATYVPPSPDLLPDLLNQWENFFHAREDIPILVRVALAHYQFEAIHPFGGGNGRVGRLLVILMLHKCGVLSLPLLYLSAFFEQNRQAYYDLLRGITEQGRWTDWIEFFLEAIISQAEDAIARSQRVIELRKKYKVQLESNYRSISYPRLLDFVFQKPIFTSPRGIEIFGCYGAEHRKHTKRIREARYYQGNHRTLSSSHLSSAGTYEFTERIVFKHAKFFGTKSFISTAKKSYSPSRVNSVGKECRPDDSTAH